MDYCSLLSPVQLPMRVFDGCSHEMQRMSVTAIRAKANWCGVIRRVVATGALALLHASRGTTGAAEPLDIAPFGISLPEKNGLLWEDPREVHKVVVQFEGKTPAAERLRLEYWGSRWPNQHLPKDREPGGADVGWMELGIGTREDGETAMWKP